MLWRYELLNTRVAYADAIIVDGGLFDAANLEQAKAKASDVGTALFPTGPNRPDTIRLVDSGGREVWREKL